MDALRGVTQAAHALDATRPSQFAITDGFPAQPVLIHAPAIIPTAVFLGVEPGRGRGVDRAHGFQGMDVPVAGLRMKVPIHDLSPIDIGGKVVADHGHYSFTGHTVRDEKLDLTGKLGVTPFLAGLHSVPKFGTVIDPLGCTFRGHDLAVADLGFSVFEGQAKAGVQDAASCPVGSTGDHRAPSGELLAGTADDLRVVVEHEVALLGVAGGVSPPRTHCEAMYQCAILTNGQPHLDASTGTCQAAIVGVVHGQ